MKKLLFLSLFIGFGAGLWAQVYVEGVKLGPDNTGQYIELTPLFRENGECTFSVDFGQANPKEDRVTDGSGKRFDFRSLIEGLNYFYDNGWEVHSVIAPEHGRRYLLKRRY